MKGQLVLGQSSVVGMSMTLNWRRNAEFQDSFNALQDCDKELYIRDESSEL